MKYGNPQLFILDINGSKGPNKLGYDLFPMKVFSDGIKLWINEMTSYNYRDKDSFSTKDMLK